MYTKFREALNSKAEHLNIPVCGPLPKIKLNENLQEGTRPKYFFQLFR